MANSLTLEEMMKLSRQVSSWKPRFDEKTIETDTWTYDAEGERVFDRYTLYTDKCWGDFNKIIIDISHLYTPRMPQFCKGHHLFAKPYFNKEYQDNYNFECICGGTYLGKVIGIGNNNPLLKSFCDEIINGQKQLIKMQEQERRRLQEESKIRITAANFAYAREILAKAQ